LAAKTDAALKPSVRIRFPPLGCAGRWKRYSAI
jgi:hypothetical protein